MSRKATAGIHAPTESWFAASKNERVYGERFETRDAVKPCRLNTSKCFATGSGCTRRWLQVTRQFLKRLAYRSTTENTGSMKPTCLEDEKSGEGQPQSRGFYLSELLDFPDQVVQVFCGVKVRAIRCNSTGWLKLASVPVPSNEPKAPIQTV